MPELFSGVFSCPFIPLTHEDVTVGTEGLKITHRKVVFWHPNSPELNYQHHDKSYTEINQDTRLWSRKQENGSGHLCQWQRYWALGMARVCGNRGTCCPQRRLSSYQPETGLGKNLRALTLSVTCDIWRWDSSRIYVGLWEWKLSRSQKVNSSSYGKGLRNLGRKSGS